MNNELRFKSIICTLVLCILCSCQEKEKTNKMNGLWKLYSMQTQNNEGLWEDWNGGMQGNLMYGGNGYMSLHLSTKDFQHFDFEYPNFTDSISEQAKNHITNTYYYMGKYNFNHEEGIVTHERISHSNPKDWGKTVQRRFSFSGDTLIIVPIESENKGLKLKWLKAAN